MLPSFNVTAANAESMLIASAAVDKFQLFSLQVNHILNYRLFHRRLVSNLEHPMEHFLNLLDLSESI